MGFNSGFKGLNGLFRFAENEIWFPCVYYHISNAVYLFLLEAQTAPACSAVRKSTEPPRVLLKINQLYMYQK
jgi:hypothetical protein